MKNKEPLKNMETADTAFCQKEFGNYKNGNKLWRLEDQWKEHMLWS